MPAPGPVLQPGPAPGGCLLCSVHTDTGARKPSQGLAVVGGAHWEEPSSNKLGPPTLDRRDPLLVSFSGLASPSVISCGKSCLLAFEISKVGRCLVRQMLGEIMQWIRSSDMSGDGKR